MPRDFVWFTNYQAIDPKAPRFRRFECGLVQDECPSADIAILREGSPPGLPDVYRRDGYEPIQNDGSQWVGVPYAPGDNPAHEELHTAWVYAERGEIRVYLGSRIISISLDQGEE